MFLDLGLQSELRATPSPSGGEDVCEVAGVDGGFRGVEGGCASVVGEDRRVVEEKAEEEKK